MSRRDITNSDKTIDTRDVEARISDLLDYVPIWTEKKGEHVCEVNGSELIVRPSSIQDEYTVEVDGDTIMLDPEDEASQPRHFTLEDAQRAAEEQAGIDAGDYDSSDVDELRALLALREEIEDVNSEYHRGTTLISESYFEDYVKDYAEDTGAISRDLAWPLNCIDWEEAASQLKIDYSEVNFDGETYLVRNT